MKSLLPFAFASRLNNGIALESLILSPHAFISETLSPETLAVKLKLIIKTCF